MPSHTELDRVNKQREGFGLPPMTQSDLDKTHAARNEFLSVQPPTPPPPPPPQASPPQEQRPPSGDIGVALGEAARLAGGIAKGVPAAAGRAVLDLLAAAQKHITEPAGAAATVLRGPGPGIPGLIPPRSGFDFNPEQFPGQPNFREVYRANIPLAQRIATEAVVDPLNFIPGAALNKFRLARGLVPPGPPIPRAPLALPPGRPTGVLPAGQIPLALPPATAPRALPPAAIPGRGRGPTIDPRTGQNIPELERAFTPPTGEITRPRVLTGQEARNVSALRDAARGDPTIKDKILKELEELTSKEGLAVAAFTKLARVIGIESARQAPEGLALSAFGTRRRVLEDALTAGVDPNLIRPQPIAQEAVTPPVIPPRGPTPTSLGSQQPGLGSLLDETLPFPRTSPLIGQPPPGGGGVNAILDELPPIRWTKWDTVRDAINVPRSLLATGELSAYLRQGGILFAGHPIKAANAIRKTFLTTFSEARSQALDLSLRQRPDFVRLVRRHGLFFADQAGQFGQREELFASRLIQKVPGLRNIVRGSERTFVNFLNQLRLDVAGDVVRGWERSGKTATVEELNRLMAFVNHASGRGSLGNLERFAPEMTALFFAPRFLTSRVQSAGDLIQALNPASTMSLRLRREIARDLAAFVSVNMGILTMLSHVPGVDVEANPLSSDFGKIRIGKTRLDFWGGFQPIARYGAQLALGKRKALTTAKTGDVSGWQIAGRFLWSKLSPQAALVPELLPLRKGEKPKNIIGQELDFTSLRGGAKIAMDKLLPLFYQDMIEAFQEEGLPGVAKVLPAAVGAGALTFDPQKNRSSRFSPQRR